MLTPSFHFNILKDFLDLINDCSGILVDKLRRDACGTGEPYDIFLDFTLSSMDIICGKIVWCKEHLHAINSSSDAPLGGAGSNLVIVMISWQGITDDFCQGTIRKAVTS